MEEKVSIDINGKHLTLNGADARSLRDKLESVFGANPAHCNCPRNYGFVTINAVSPTN